MYSVLADIKCDNYVCHPNPCQNKLIFDSKTSQAHFVLPFWKLPAYPLERKVLYRRPQTQYVLFGQYCPSGTFRREMVLKYYIPKTAGLMYILSDTIINTGLCFHSIIYANSKVL